MSKYTLTILSKNKDYLTQFLDFFFINLKQNSQVFSKLFRKRKFKEKISVLKSPHVNKTAQEQFKYIHFYINITFHTSEIKKELFVLKKIKNQLFPDLKIIVKSCHSSKSNVFFSNAKFYSSKLKSNYLFDKTMSTLKFLDYYGTLKKSKFG